MMVCCLVWPWPVLRRCRTLHAVCTHAALLFQSVLPLCQPVAASPGKVCDEEHMTMDIKLMKAANINAVRCSHHPNDSRW
jgi:hypothetical protein